MNVRKEAKLSFHERIRWKESGVPANLEQFVDSRREGGYWNHQTAVGAAAVPSLRHRTVRMVLVKCQHRSNQEPSGYR